MDNKVMRNDNEFLFLCDCNSCEHQFIARWDNEDKEVYISIHLFNYQNFWQRLWEGIKYIFGYKCRFGQFDEIILRKEDADKLQTIVDYLKKCN